MKRIWIPTAVVLGLLCSGGASEEQVAGQSGQDIKAHPLWSDAIPGAKGTTAADVPLIWVHLPPEDKATGAAVVICPGGGYGHLAMDHEGHAVAEWLNSFGVAGIVLQYRLAPKYHHPIPLTDAAGAMRLTRAEAKTWHIDPERVGILGFSAGGHLASTVGTHFDAGLKDAKDPIDRESSRPDFLILGYPVITLTGPYAHAGSRRNLLGDAPDPQLVEDLSNEKQVTPRTPPTFLVHTTEDKGVPPENSILFYRALRQHKIPAEMHIYEKGAHGLGLGVGRTELPFKSWPQRCEAWLQGRGLLKR
jgi:acetyl esterase/lipase